MGGNHSKQGNHDTFFSNSPYDYDQEERRQELEAELKAAKNALKMCNDARHDVTVTSAAHHAAEAKRIKKELKRYR